MIRLKKGRARRAKVKALRTKSLYKLRTEFADLAIDGAAFFIMGPFTSQSEHMFYDLECAHREAEARKARSKP